MDVNTLYRFYNLHGLLLYVGITLDPPQRFKDHAAVKEWWTEVESIKLERFDTREALVIAESEAIRVEHPVYNITYNGDHAERIRCPNCGCSLVLMLGEAAVKHGVPPEKYADVQF